MKKYEIGIQNHEYGFMTVETDLKPESDEFNEMIHEKFGNGEYHTNKNEMDWEIQNKEIEKTAIVSGHLISYWFHDDNLELNDIDIEHIKKSIDEGYREGELNQLVDDEEIRGWWGISR